MLGIIVLVVSVTVGFIFVALGYMAGDGQEHKDETVPDQLV